MEVFETAGGPGGLAYCDPRQLLGRSRAGDGVRRDILEHDRSGVGIGEAVVEFI